VTDGWLAALDEDDRALFFTEMRAALDLAEASGDIGPGGRCLRAWQVTGEALADPMRRAVLTGTGNSDYGEVPRP
jgi:hypothetical protein